MPFDKYIEKALLDWSTGAAAVTRQIALFVNFESGTPTYSSDSEAPCSRTAILFAAGSTGATGSVSNSAGMSASASSNCTIFYWGIYASSAGGSRLAYGSLTASHTLRAGSQAGFAAGGLVITMS